MRTVRTAFVVLVVLVSFVSSQAATYVVPRDEFLVDDALGIVTGSVIDVYARSTPSGEIETVSVIAVDEVLKGAMPTDRVEVVEWGGRIGDTWMVMSGAPHYVPGRRYLLFLVADHAGRWTTEHLALGQFAFVVSAEGEVLQREEEIRGWTIDGAPSVERARPAREFLDLVRSRVKNPPAREAMQSNRPVRIGPDAGDYDFVEGCTLGASVWTNDANSTIQYTISGTPATGDTKAAGDGEDRIIEEDPHNDITNSFTQQGGVIATTFSTGQPGTVFPNNKSYISITGSDIVTQDGVKTFLSQAFFRSAMAHELGHSLGFRHSDKSADNTSSCSAPLPCSGNAIMTASVVVSNAVLKSWDLDAARASYGTGGGEPADYGGKFCANNACTTFTTETARRTDDNAKTAWRLSRAVVNCTQPSISTQPQNKTIGIGGTTSLSVVAAGTAPLSYQWFIGASNTDESNPIGGATSATLSNLSPAVTTKYWVKVTNTCGSAGSTVATVTVQECVPPSITSQPQAKTIAAGGSAKMSVTAAGTTPLTYQWYVGNSGDTSNPIAGATSASPTIAPESTINVWVRVTGQCGTPVDSNSVTITVSACADVVVGTPTATGAVSTWTLTVTANSLANGPLTYEWFRGSNPGSNVAPKVGDGQTIVVTVDAVTQFWAKVTNACGSSKASGLVVVAPCQLPVIATQPADQTVAKNANVQLSVGSTGEGVSVQWFEGVAPDKTKPIGAGATLQVNAIQSTTSYWAALTNTCGEVVTRTATITVTDAPPPPPPCEAPVVTTEPVASQLILSGSSASLSVVATGTPLLKYEWFEGAVGATNKPVGTDSPLFSTPPLTATTRYWVRISNACGVANSRSAEVSVASLRRRAARH